jgi:hypothetical protein
VSPPRPRRPLRAGPAAGLAALALLAGCSSSDITGEPEDIGTLVQVVASGSHCIADGGDAILHVTLENTGEDERTVNVSPVLRDDDGTTTASPLEAVEVTVSGGDEASADATVDAPPDDLAGCAVSLDGGDPVEIALRTR